MYKLNHVLHRTLHTLVEDVEEFKDYYELFKKYQLPDVYEERFPQILERLDYLEAIEIVYHKVLNKEVQLTSFLNYLNIRYNNLTNEEVLCYYENIIKVFGEEFIYNKLEKITQVRMGRLLIEHFNHNHLHPMVWWEQYYENRPNQKPSIKRKLRPYATSENWWLSPREEKKGLYKKRYRQKLKRELNKELNEYFTNTY